ncbi:Hypothetical predicted protein [Lecanosticta acicola]|uniref:Uncharacterized protein n=1 Tax=Lecanosticta acicola TaxID=111012 RepID=A0AAI9EAK1_9PEZI|nr:Hypothetical predicted protein [Lecanosticta acicola]
MAAAATTASAVNGHLTPPVRSDADADGPSKIETDFSANKRKREDDLSEASTAAANARDGQVQRDILHVLRSHDPDSSFLNHRFIDSLSHQNCPKKPRLSDPSNQTFTISTKLDHGSYTSLRQLKADADTVGEELVTEIRSKAKDRESTGNRTTVGELKQIQRIQMIQRLVREIVDRESQYDDAQTKDVGPKDAEPKEESSTPAVGHETADATAKAGTVLTLFGNAPTPKQLFSSSQMPPKAEGQGLIKSELLVEEMTLPNGISATKLMPVPSDHSTKLPLLEDVFPPPYNLPALNPPRTHKRSSTRDNKVTWEFKDSTVRNKKGGYTVQPQNAGSWLGYGGVDDSDSNSTREKRKERTRALSTSADTVERPSKALSEEAQAREEEALFRRAYSSFAPTYDDSNAPISTETKNLVWWHKVGNKRFNSVLAIDPALMDETERSSIPPPQEQASAQDEDFSRVVKDLDELDGLEPDPEPVKSKTAVDHVLREVSELLETLASHQRIRNATLASASAASRTPISPSPAVSSKVNKPDEPSEDEYSTYRSLQRELAYLILKLPPYAVAKLDGDQLAELGVSKLLKIQPRDIKGTMEEDHVARQARLSATATTNSITTLARSNSSAGQHYNTTAQRTPAIGQAANTRYGQQYGSRAPATAPAFQRQASNPQHYGTPTAAGPRPGYPQPNQWPRPGAQPAYGQPNGHQYYQRPQQTPTGYGHYGQQYQQTPQAQQRYNPQAYAQNRPAANAVAYQTNSAVQQQGFTRTVSPVKAAGYPAVSMAPAQTPRPIYPTGQPSSGRATPTGYPSQPHTPVNGFGPRQPPGIAPRPASSTPQPPPQPIQSNGNT